MEDYALNAALAHVDALGDDELKATGALVQQGERIIVSEARYRHVRDQSTGGAVRRLYLRLADGRGWVPLRHPSGKSLFQRAGQLAGHTSY